MNWREQVEARIADVRPQEYPHGKSLYYFTAEVREQLAASLEALLDVAVAADVIMRNYDNQTTSVIAWDALSFALDKLREVGDE